MNARKGIDATLGLLVGAEGKRTECRLSAMSYPEQGLLDYTLSGDPLQTVGGHFTGTSHGPYP